jgi:hypothetical protein
MIRIFVSQLLSQLFLPFFENNVLSQFGAVLFELDFALDFLLVFACPINLAGRFVTELNELFLFIRHDSKIMPEYYNLYSHFLQSCTKKAGMIRTSRPPSLFFLT